MKKMPGWLKFACIFASIFLTMVLYVSIYLKGPPEILIKVLFFYPMAAWLICGSSCDTIIANILVVFAGTTAYFVMGAILGFVYNVIKKIIRR